MKANHEAPEQHGMFSIERGGETYALQLERDSGYLLAWLYPWPRPDDHADRDRYALDLSELGEQESWYGDSDDHVACLIETALNRTDAEGQPVPYAFAVAGAAERR